MHKNGRIVAWCLVEREAAVTGYRIVEENDGGLEAAFVKNLALRGGQSDLRLLVEFELTL